MFQDMSLSKDLNERFKSRIASSGDPLEGKREGRRWREGCIIVDVFEWLCMCMYNVHVFSSLNTVCQWISQSMC